MTTQIKSIAEKLPQWMRRIFFTWCKDYSNAPQHSTRRVMLGRDLQSVFGVSIDEKNYGADQNEERPVRDYSHIPDSGSNEPY